MRRSIKYLLIFVTLLTVQGNAWAQCAMCRASMENSISSNSENFSAGLNMGILYLFVTPYLLIGLIGYLWYRARKANAKKIQVRIHH